MPDPSGDRRSLKRTLPPDLHWLAPLEVHGLVRVGGDGDGGYVVPVRLIEDTEILVSMGIGFDWQFERHFKRLAPDVSIQAYDCTVSRRSFRKFFLLGVLALLTGRAGPGEIRSRFRLLRDYTQFFPRHATHHMERIHNRIERPGDVDIATVFQRAGRGRKFLKMDIEGTEYRVIEDVMQHARELVGLVVEFHDTEPLRPVFVRAVQRIMRDFEIVHVHANNFIAPGGDGLPESLEVTFARREYCAAARRRTELPLPDLDRPNCPDRPDFELTFSMPD